MRSKGAIKIVPNNGQSSYNRIFLVNISFGGWRPVVDLSPLKRFILLMKLGVEIIVTVPFPSRKETV